MSTPEICCSAAAPALHSLHKMFVRWKDSLFLLDSPMHQGQDICVLKMFVMMRPLANIRPMCPQPESGLMATSPRMTSRPVLLRKGGMLACVL
eukprot:5650830-Amphidinium_carterae.1